MKRMKHSKLNLHRETLQRLDSEKLSLIHGGLSALCGPSATCNTRGCGGTAACPPESNNCDTGSAGCNVT
jgi:hypothetical protein